MHIDVTKHARRRIRERLGLPARSIAREARRVWQDQRRLSDIDPVTYSNFIHRDAAGGSIVLLLDRQGRVWVFACHSPDVAVVTVMKPVVVDGAAPLVRQAGQERPLHSRQRFHGGKFTPSMEQRKFVMQSTGGW